jgi:hypothetical protein
MFGFPPSRTKKATAITCAIALLAGSASMVATPASAAGPSLYGCPYGAVCIYPQNKGLNGGHPEAGGVYFSYGAHNLRNQFGNHTIVNNQYGGARYVLCTGYGGSGSCTKSVPPGRAEYNLTPINSIVLTRFCPPTHCPPV